ncbi:MAG TPA: hypothetical protein VGM65_07595 [Candidatus Udaeobacter sp.]|jgi:sugar lactone lactonase YvrE
MNKKFVALTVAGLGTILLSISADAGALAFDAAGNLFAADGHSIFKYTPDGTRSTFAAGLHPLSLCFDSEGNLFVVDDAVTEAKSSILKFTPDGKKSTVAKGTNPDGMAFDRSGNLVVSQGDSIFKFTPKGIKRTFVISKPFPDFTDLVFDAAGNHFVTDEHSISKFAPDGTKSTFVGGLDHPTGLAVDAVGNVYVTVVTAPDASSHAILKFSPDGTKSTFTSLPGSFFAGDLAIDRSGNLFVWNSHAILKIDPSGTPTTFASNWVSADKQWEYECAEYPRIVKAGTTQVVLDLDQELKVNGPGRRVADLFWAPDSKRFAFNYIPAHANDTSRETVALYQLRGDKWVALHSPVDKASERAQLAQLAEKYLPKNSYRRRFLDSAPEDDTLKVRKWADANAAILYAYLRTDEAQAAVLFTMKFDAEGNWKIVQTHLLSKKELVKELEEEL